MRQRRSGRSGVLAAVALAAPLWAAAAGLLTVPSAALAQEGPLVLGRREKRPFLTLDPWQASAELLFLGQFDQTSGGGSGSSVAMQQTLTLGTGGGIASKNFLEWRGSVTVGAEEDWSQAPGNNQSGYGLVNSYDLSLAILKNSMVPVTVYGRRGETYTTRSFAGMLKNTREEYGVLGNIRGPVPSRFHAYNATTEQSEMGGRKLYGLTEDHFEFQSLYQSPDDRHEVSFSYVYAGVTQDNSGVYNSDFQNHTTALAHAWKLDGSDRYILNQSLNYLNQSGAYPYTTLRLDERLTMRHTEWLESYFNYAFDQQDYGGAQSTAHQINGGLTHRLFESLSTTVRGGYAMTEQNGGSSVTSYFADLALNYTKRVPYGQLTLYGNTGMTNQDTTGSGLPIQVFHQPQIFSDPVPIVLSTQNINPATVALFNSSGTRRYQQGLDYTVTVRNRRVEIRRVLGGAIESNEPVLVDYQVLGSPPYQSSTTTFGLGARYDFRETFLKGLGVYARYYQQDQTIESQVPGYLLPENINDISIGADYTVWKLIFNAEVQEHESSLSGYSAARFSARFFERLSDRASLSLNLRESLVEYKTDPSSTWLTTFDARLTYDITRNMKASLYAAYRHEEDSRYGRTDGFEQDAELRWDVRQTHIFMRVRNTMLDTNGNSNFTTFFQLGLRRDF